MSETSLTVAEFRKLVRAQFPHVTVKVRKVDFSGMGYATAKCLTVSGDKSPDELTTINTWAQRAGIVPDGSIRGYHFKPS